MVHCKSSFFSVTHCAIDLKGTPFEIVRRRKREESATTHNNSRSTVGPQKPSPRHRGSRGTLSFAFRCKRREASSPSSSASPRNTPSPPPSGSVHVAELSRPRSRWCCSASNVVVAARYSGMRRASDNGRRPCPPVMHSRARTRCGGRDTSSCNDALVAAVAVGHQRGGVPKTALRRSNMHPSRICTPSHQLVNTVILGYDFRAILYLLAFSSRLFQARVAHRSCLHMSERFTPFISSSRRCLLKCVPSAAWSAGCSQSYQLCVLIRRPTGCGVHTCSVYTVHTCTCISLYAFLHRRLATCSDSVLAAPGRNELHGTEGILRSRIAKSSSRCNASQQGPILARYKHA